LINDSLSSNLRDEPVNKCLKRETAQSTTTRESHLKRRSSHRSIVKQGKPIEVVVNAR
jgi:hypothetical protein